MSWVCEVIVTGHETERPSLDAWLSRTASPCWRSFPGLSSLDVYEPAQEKGRDPYNHQEASPLLIAILEFESESALKTAVDGSAFPEALRALPPGLEAKASAFERAFYAVEDGETEGALSAPVSYVVRYYRPAENEAAFIENYVSSHPPTQAKLPRIRSIMCYFPRPDLACRTWPAVDYLIGNEVVFDSVEDFNRAMESPVRQELRAHFREFPTFSGVNSHHLMQRRRLHG